MSQEKGRKERKGKEELEGKKGEREDRQPITIAFHLFSDVIMKLIVNGHRALRGSIHVCMAPSEFHFCQFSQLLDEISAFVSLRGSLFFPTHLLVSKRSSRHLSSGLLTLEPLFVSKKLSALNSEHNLRAGGGNRVVFVIQTEKSNWRKRICIQKWETVACRALLG